MKRRNFLFISGGTGLLLLGALAMFKFQDLRIIYRKLKGRLRSRTRPVESLELLSRLPGTDKGISIETALNSRCTSDSDNDPEVFHWGMFDVGYTLPAHLVEEIGNLAKLPFISPDDSWIITDDAILSVLIHRENGSASQARAHIQGGMYQQALCLSCSALGAGMVFMNQGKDGKNTDDATSRLIKIRVGAAKPSYNGSHWTDVAPITEREWVSGNLPDPKRRGAMALAEALQKSRLSSSTGSGATVEDLSQLLWAARGRTPHLCKSTPWGLTIPTWGGGKDELSTMHWVTDSSVYQYANMAGKHPSHSLIRLQDVEMAPVDIMDANEWENQGLIVFGVNEEHNRALWEVGYQMLNILLQLVPMKLAFRHVFLNTQQRERLQALGIQNPVAALILRTTASLDV